jgi:predicted N-acetyltransferase YhbS
MRVAAIARHDVGMTTEIRVLDGEGDLVAAANVFRTAMIGFPRLAGLEAGQIARLLEPGRTIGAFVDGQLVGTADSVTSSLTLPGGNRVGHAAVTHVGVLPSFTRRGVATDLMRHQLHDVAARGEAVATLRASEATIYERYGYGMASTSQTVEVHTARAALRPGVASGGPVRLLDPAEVWEVLPRIYNDNRPSRPGTIDRPDVWWAFDSAPNPAPALGMSRCMAQLGPRRDSSATVRPIPTSGSSAINAPSSWKTSSRPTSIPTSVCCAFFWDST